MAIQMAYVSSKKLKRTLHVVSSNVEHPAVAKYLDRLKDNGQIKVTLVPVESDGRVSAKSVIDAIKSNTVFVSLMLANNESGAIMPIREVSEHCRKAGILFHTDAAQAAGKISVNLDDLGDPDMVTIVGHKMGAPKGVACLYVRPGCLTDKGRKYHDNGVFFEGGGQEYGRRSGTENVPYCVGLGKAALIAAESYEANREHMESMRLRLLQKITARLGTDKVRVNGPAEHTVCKL
jgi:cysteine desulfurase